MTDCSDAARCHHTFKSSWSSPVVLVRKKDGSHHFCVDYQHLNEVTKTDTFPLPRIDDMLDQLGQCKCFSTLDLAAEYWQIRMHPESIEKTAFCTPQGLFEFQVMPFGLTNAPAVFQCLIQQVISGLNPAEGPDFVAAYIDDIIVFSPTLEQHITHLKVVLERIINVGLKLKPTNRLIRSEVEYLGHIITPQGLKTNPRLVSAVVEFPVPQNLREVRQFLGMCSYYRRFIPCFSVIARPLHHLTRKGAEFVWSPDCEGGFRALKEKLTHPPVLAYPSFEKSFVLETDASGSGLGAVLSQPLDDNVNHPIAYASRSLSPAESNYNITELEMLAVVWAVTHFKAYLYSHNVTVYSDNAAVRAVLETPHPSGKHARWWSKVYESGIRNIHIIHKSGRSNTNADALSHQPTGPLPETVDEEIQVAAVSSENLFSVEPGSELNGKTPSFAEDQRQGPHLRELITYLERGVLPVDEARGRKLVLQGTQFSLVDDAVYFIDPKAKGLKRAAVPQHLQHQIMKEAHGTGGSMGGHFAGA